VVCNVEPVRPSTRLGALTASDLTGVSRHRQVEPPKLIREVRGDLDWIAMKALEKDRSRRYSTVNGLATDLRRYLAGEAITAHPPSFSYKFQKLFLRNKLLVSGLGLFILSLIGLLGFMGILLAREKQLRQNSDLLAADSQANFYISSSRLDQAESMLLRALEIRRKMSPDYLPGPESLRNLLWALVVQRKFDEAEGLMNKILANVSPSRKEYVELLALRADTLARCGRWAKAEADARKIFELQPENFTYSHLLAPLAVANKDLEVYRRLCAQIVVRFRNINDVVPADQLAKDCLILTDSGADMDVVAGFANFAVANGQLHPAYPFFQCCKALAEYRRRHWDVAVKWAQFAAANPFPYSRAEALAIICMGQCKQNHVEDARGTMAMCQKIVTEKLPKLGTSNLGGDWRDWIIAHALLTEAQDLLATFPPAAASANPMKPESK